MNRQLSQVGDFVFSLVPDDVPEAARRAALMLLDTLGVAAAAARAFAIPDAVPDVRGR
jgi:2-methylcitrate dehydratase PrpD